MDCSLNIRMAALQPPEYPLFSVCLLNLIWYFLATDSNDFGEALSISQICLGENNEVSRFKHWSKILSCPYAITKKQTEGTVKWLIEEVILIQTEATEYTSAVACQSDKYNHQSAFGRTS